MNNLKRLLNATLAVSIFIASGCAYQAPTMTSTVNVEGLTPNGKQAVEGFVKLLKNEEASADEKDALAVEIGMQGAEDPDFGDSTIGYLESARKRKGLTTTTSATPTPAATATPTTTASASTGGSNPGLPSGTDTGVDAGGYSLFTDGSVNTATYTVDGNLVKMEVDASASTTFAVQVKDSNGNVIKTASATKNASNGKASVTFQPTVGGNSAVYTVTVNGSTVTLIFKKN